jgi:hypothetical protein
MEPEYRTLKKLSESTGMAVRTLREHLRDPVRPLPHFRVKGLILVKTKEFEEWIEGYRVDTPAKTRAIVEEIVRDREKASPGVASAPARGPIPKGWELAG